MVNVYILRVNLRGTIIIGGKDKTKIDINISICIKAKNY